MAKQEYCREWNSGREEGSTKYSTETYDPSGVFNRNFDDSHQHRFDNLLQRYEEPSSMVRWDSPLFTVPWTDESPPNEDIWKAVTEGPVKPPNVGTQSVGQRIRYVVSWLKFSLRYRKRPQTRSTYWSTPQQQ